MFSKRLVDLLILASTTRQILQQHIRLRAGQLDLYSQTCFITKPFRERRYATPQSQGVKAQAEEQFDAHKGVREWVRTQPREETVKDKVEKGEEERDIPITKADDERIQGDSRAQVMTTPENTEPAKPIPPTKDVDSDLFLLRTARRSSSLLGSIRKHPKSAEKEQAVYMPGKREEKDKEIDQRPPALWSEIPLSAISVGDPSIAAPEQPPSISTPPEPVVTDTRKESTPVSTSTQPVFVESFPPDEASTITTTPSPTRTAVEVKPQERTSPTTITTTTPPSPLPAPASTAPPLNPSDIDLTIQSLTTESSQLNQQQQLATSPSGHTMTASSVPSSRFSRMMHYTGLGIGMTFGALTEGIKRAAVGTPNGTPSSLMLSEANVERLVKKLSRMRGAALKLGQMLSFQDTKLLPPPLHQILSRVQDSADYMPPSQLRPILTRTLGPNWQSLFPTFNLIPIAAASIGQVHLATLSPELIPPSDPRSPKHPNHTPAPYPVAVKIQYPGVKDSITSDLTNLSLLLTASRLLPRGMYLDKTIANARTELAWECDYTREAEGIRKFRNLLPPENEGPFVIPNVIQEASGEDVLTMEYMSGKPITGIKDLTQDERDWICTQIMRLALREIAEWKCMQTDPNFSNFLYDRDEGKIHLLDFGAWREYPVDFVNTYLSLLRAGRKRDFSACRELSIQLGYLTGLESKSMVDTHVQSIFILAEPFRGAGVGEGGDGGYDFSQQTVTDRVKSLIPLMLRERLTPPPQETYSLHRKLSGVFLLCARLGGRVGCAKVFEEVVGG